MNVRIIGIGLLLAVVAGCSASPPPPANLVFISLDTVRRDHLPIYGYHRDTTPNITAWAETSIVFDNAFAQDTNTNPSHASMFTGVYPHTHGSRNNGDSLDPGQIPLAQILRSNRFRTAGFVSGWPMNRLACGLERGFDRYDDELIGSHRRSGTVATAHALEWLDRHGPNERYFLFLHLYDVHGPYSPGPKFEDAFVSDEPGRPLDRIPSYQVFDGPDGRPAFHTNQYVDRYDSAIRLVDDLVGQLLSRVDLDDTVVVLVSDHGETLDERFHMLDHGGQVYDEQIRIPMILSSPGVEPGRVTSMVETIDLLPTLLELLEIERPADRPVEGRNLLDPERTESEFTFASARGVDTRHLDRGYSIDRLRKIHSVRSSDWKLIRFPGTTDDYLELYDLTTDPGETENVAERHPRLRDRYFEILQDWMGDDQREMPTELDPVQYEKLKALGYIDD